MLTYVTAKHISVYEVREGSILKDTSYTGIIIREEEVVSAQGSGYVNFLSQKAVKLVKKRMSIVFPMKKLIFHLRKLLLMRTEIL